MTSTTPRHAITFLGQTARHAGKLGLRKGLQKAAARANPATMVVESAISVMEAVESWYALKQARAERDGLELYQRNLEERLCIERKDLKCKLEVLKADVEARVEVKERLSELAQQCALACMTVFSELEEIRASDIPDLAEFDKKLADLENEWHRFRHALANYRDIA